MMAGFNLKTIGDIAGIAGGIKGLFSGGDDEADRLQTNFESQLQLQKKALKKGIRWRVEDAKKAGLHPLFALGASVPHVSSPVAIGAPDGYADMGAAGQNLSRALKAVETPEERKMRAMNLEYLATQMDKEKAIADYYRSEAAVNRQTDEASKPVAKAFPMGSKQPNQQLRSYDMGDYYDTARAQPDRVISLRSTDPSISAATHSTWKEYTVKPGVVGVVPFSEEGISESLQDANWERVWAIYNRNKEIYGQKAAKRFMRSLFPGWGTFYGGLHDVMDSGRRIMNKYVPDKFWEQR